MMAKIDRGKVIALDRMRHARRAALRNDLVRAQHDLHPKTLARRWTKRQKARLTKTAAESGKKLEKNAPMLGIIGTAILLFAARKPISLFIAKRREARQNRTDFDEQNR